MQKPTMTTCNEQFVCLQVQTEHNECNIPNKNACDIRQPLGVNLSLVVAVAVVIVNKTKHNNEEHISDKHAISAEL